MHDHGDEHATKAGHPLIDRSTTPLPMYRPHGKTGVTILNMVADELDRLHDERDAAIAQRDKLAEVLTELRDQQTRMVQAGGADGPLPQDVIESFARTNLDIWARAEQALAEAGGGE